VHSQAALLRHFGVKKSKKVKKDDDGFNDQSPVGENDMFDNKLCEDRKPIM